MNFQDVLDEWLSCQKAWLYLESIFSSDDINRQLPVESKRYQTMERIWRKVMMSAIDCPQVITLCPDNRLLENLHECNKLLEQVQKGLSEYLETKRNAFPRFYFLSDDELLEILSQTKDPTAVQPHLHKCFENIARVSHVCIICIVDLFVLCHMIYFIESSSNMVDEYCQWYLWSEMEIWLCQSCDFMFSC